MTYYIHLTISLHIEMDQRYFSGICEYNKVGRQDKTIQDKTRQDKTMQDKTRQDKARQGKYNHKVYIVAAICQWRSRDLTKKV